MKKSMICFLIFASVSVQAKVCEVKASYDALNNKIILSLEDKEVAENDDYGSIFNSRNLDCSGVISEIIKSGKKTATVNGSEIPLQLVHTINL